MYQPWVPAFSPVPPSRPDPAIAEPSVYLPGAIEWRRILPPTSDRQLRWAAVLLAYGVAFTLLRSSAALWSTHELFSLWFPAAGLRFAFLWWAGPRIAPLAALAELLVSVSAGTVQFGPAPLLTLAGVVGPCLVYGLVIYAVRRRSGTLAGTAGDDPMVFALAVFLAPIAACIAAMPWALPLAMQNGPIDGQVLFSALLVFTLGDMLGIVIVAPLLLWLARGADRSRVDVRVAARRLGGPMLALAAAGGLVWTMYQLGYGLQLAPILLATGWVGLRGGRAVAFPAILLTVAIVLSISAGADDDAVRVRTHLMLACIIASGYLAGSYADAQRLSAMEISRRDRLLYHAERLKTLRAMSIAVIHEVSQPLSTISLEANGLLAATESGSPDVGQIRQMAQMIAKKTAELSELVRRLRHYGERGGSDSSTLPASAIVGDVQELAQAEAQASRVRLECAAGPAVRVTCNEVEMQQALLNLLRNAIAAAASADRVVQLGWIASTEQVTFFVDNAVVARHPQPYGMGIGLMIVRGIARAHGGHLTVSQSEPGRVRHSLVIPIAKTP